MKRLIMLFMGLSLAGCGSLEPSSVKQVDIKQRTEGDIEAFVHWPDQVKETSGLSYGAGQLWTINDSGDGPILYGIDKKNQVSKVVHVEGAENIDWEELAQDEHYLYIADCGNNRGDRDRLQIYKVLWSELRQVVTGGSVPSEKIVFSYADKEGEVNKYAHNFDCEALTIVNGKLWLFTKNRGDKQTKLYLLDTKSVEQEISPVASYPVEGLITAADYDHQRKRLVLLGYQKGVILGQSFIWTMPVNGLPGWDHAKKVVLKPFAQWEAILWDPKGKDGELLLTSEKNPLLDVGIGILRLSEN